MEMYAAGLKSRVWKFSRIQLILSPNNVCHIMNGFFYVLKIYEKQSLSFLVEYYFC